MPMANCYASVDIRKIKERGFSLFVSGLRATENSVCNVTFKLIKTKIAMFIARANFR